MQLIKRIFRIPLHVLLITIYPVLFLYFNNINELPRGIFLIPCILSGVFSILLFTLIFRIYKHINKSGIITSLFLILFFTYGHIALLFFNWGWGQLTVAGFRIGASSFIAPLYLIVALIGIYCFRRMHGDFINSTICFNITSLLLVSMMILNILGYENKIHKGSFQEDNSSHIDISLKAKDPKPDIYYIILDAYPRADILNKYYNYDNSPFLGKLEDLGFNVIEKSQSNYDTTRYSVRSTLEIEYIDKLFSSRSEYDIDNKLRGLKHVNVLRILYGNGYKTYAFKQKFHLIDLENSPYITSVLKNKSGINSFDDLLLKSTPFLAVYDLLKFGIYRHRLRQLFILDSLPAFFKLEGSNFIYAHITCPHLPIIFDVNGDDPINWSQNFNNMFVLKEPGSNKDKKDIALKKNFYGQLTYLNNRILQIIETILKNSEKEPVIIIQSDHSPKYMTRYFEAALSVKFYNLSAIYLPNGRQQEIPPDASNVNTFRYVFNYVFNTELPILPNKHYLIGKSNTLDLMSDFNNDCIK